MVAWAFGSCAPWLFARRVSLVEATSGLRLGTSWVRYGVVVPGGAGMAKAVASVAVSRAWTSWRHPAAARIQE